MSLKLSVSKNNARKVVGWNRLPMGNRILGVPGQEDISCYTILLISHWLSIDPNDDDHSAYFCR